MQLKANGSNILLLSGWWLPCDPKFAAGTTLLTEPSTHISGRKMIFYAKIDISQCSKI
jgi:hypothetical protein